MSQICQELNLGSSDVLPEVSKNPKCVYDLYAISNHFGTLSGGHYTAYCKNAITGKFYEFDDTNVSQIEETKIATNAAYVLFYKLRTWMYLDLGF